MFLSYDNDLAAKLSHFAFSRLKSLRPVYKTEGTLNRAPMDNAPAVGASG
jgi:hypothetical protein